MNASFIDLQKTLRRPLIERLTPQRAPAHTQEEFDAAYTASFMRDPSILPLTCTCAEVYADCRYLAASALRTSHDTMVQALSLVQSSSRIVWYGDAGTAFREQCAVLASALDCSSSRIYADQVMIT